MSLGGAPGLARASATAEGPGAEDRAGPADADPETEPTTETEPASETDTASEAEPTSKPEPNSEPDAAPDADTEPAGPTLPKLADSETEPETEAEGEAETEGEADAEAESESEAEPEEDPLPPGVPERLPVLQQAGWWTVFGAFVLGTTAGVFAGLAERQEDRATRLASRFDLESQAQLRYEDERDAYETLLRRGEAFQNTAIGLGVASGAVLIVGAALFIVDRRRSRRGSPKRARLRPRVGGFEVHF